MAKKYFYYVEVITVLQKVPYETRHAIRTKKNCLQLIDATIFFVARPCSDRILNCTKLLVCISSLRYIFVTWQAEYVYKVSPSSAANLYICICTTFKNLRVTGIILCYYMLCFICNNFSFNTHELFIS